jgi:pimeloyl-ACP methyl ester carboxylesterase
MATFLLVHGAWHGGWCWRKVTPLLREAGHDVLTPSLTGLGDRAHLLAPDIDLTTHVGDVCGVLEYEDLHDAVLVGHSYGGIVITAVADRLAERLAHLVYLDAFVPGDGQSLFDLVAPTARASFEEQARTAGDGWRVPPFSLAQWRVTDDADVRWMSPRIGVQPIRTFSEPVRLTRQPPPALARTYLSCTVGRAPHYEAIARRVREHAGWRYHELATGHDAMVTAPRALADALLDCVDTRRRDVV